MVCTVSDIKTAGAASAYYSQTDDYYRDAGHAPTAWQGKGAEALGLRGEVETHQAESMLEGRLPNGERVGGDDHRPGWDATFSAPKSVSVAAYVHGDDRLIASHDEAVREAVAWLEREVSCTRIREGGEIRTEATGNLIAATYRHDVSREGEPDLHTHSVIMNATQSADGQWRSLESRPLYRLQTEAGAVYRAAMARQCERLGYSIEKTVAGDHPSFELREVSQAERELFSSRSRQIEAELARMGLTRKTATAAQKQIAALNTRQAKENLGRGNLLSEWREQSRQAGHEPSQRPEAQSIDAHIYRDRSDDAVKQAVEHLSERESRFSEKQIVTEARKIGMGEIDDRDIRSSIERAVESGELARTTTRQYDFITGMKQEGVGITTREARQTELHMLAQADRAAGAAQPAMTLEGADRAIRAQEEKTGFSFNQAQVDVTRAVLTGTDRITLVQGYAGTAKTTSVLSAAADALRLQGYEVIALAPMNSSAETLGAAIGAEGQTVAKFLNSKPEQPGQPRVYMVDEASMLSARDMDKLLSGTRDGRLVLVGDVKQLGSVEAGAAFRQLQTDSSLKTRVLDEIVRQRNDELRAAVYDAIRGDARGALAKVEVRELATREERAEAIAKYYTGLTRDEREQTIVISPGRDDRREINDAVRAELKGRGGLSGEVVVQVLDRKDLTKVEAAKAASYSIGDHIQAARDYQSLGLRRGEAAKVVSVDVDKNKLTIENSRGEQKQIDPSKYTKLQAFEPRTLHVAEGDRLVNRENADSLKNGAVLRVEKIDEKHIHARDDAGKLHRLDVTARHKLDHGYAQTGHESQGRTANRTLFHAESNRVNLISQQNFYVPISRAKDEVIVFTDDREKLIAQIERESGQKETALDRNSESEMHFGNRKPERERAPWDMPESQPQHDRAGDIVEKSPTTEREFER